MFLSQKHGTEFRFMRSCRTNFSTVPLHVTSDVIYVTSRTPFYEAPFLSVRGWGLHAVTLIILLLMLVRGCWCALECSVKELERTPWHLKFNQSEARTDECLTVTETTIVNICEAATTERVKKMRQTSTSFCGLPLINVLSDQDIHNVEQCSKDRGCYDSLKYIENLDKSLSCMFHGTFVELVERRSCADYSVRGNCEKCKEAYRNWLCSQYVTYYLEGEPIKPCLTFCDQVAQYCPFFRPLGEAQIGEPGFLCKDSYVDNIGENSTYGAQNCCYEPCHVFGPSEYCPTLNLTSNCTVSTSGAALLNSNLLYCLGLCLLASWIHKTIIHSICIGLT